MVLVSGKPSKDDEYILLLDGVDTRDDAQRLRGAVLFVREEERDVKETTTAISQYQNAVPNTATITTTDNNNNHNNKKEEEEYFISDLVGLEVFLLEDEPEKMTSSPFVGTVAGVVFASDMCSIPGLGHDMLEVNLPRGKGGTVSLRDELVLIPFVPQIVPRVSIQQGTIHITPPAGLLDLTYVREEKVRIKGFLPSSD